MRKLLMTAVSVLLMTFTVPTFAIEDSQLPKDPGPNFDRKKAKIVKVLQDGITDLQEEIECIQNAKNDDDLRACHEDRKAKMRAELEERRRRSRTGSTNSLVAPQNQ